MVFEIQILFSHVLILVFLLFDMSGFSLLIFKSSLYVPDNLLSDICLRNVFFYSVPCLFLLSMVSFDIQKILMLKEFCLSILSFVLSILVCVSSFRFGYPKVTKVLMCVLLDLYCYMFPI